MSLLALLKAVHVLAVVLWVGGMAFAHVCLRPSVAVLEPAVRLPLLHAVMGRFLRVAGWSALVILGSGVWLIGRTARMAAESGGRFAMPLDWSVMAGVGLLMIALYGHIRFALYRRMDRAIQAGDLPAAGAAMAGIRQAVLANLVLGLALTAFVLVW